MKKLSLLPMSLIIMVLVVAGYIFIPAYQPTHTSEGWTQGEPMPTERSEVIATALNGKIYVAGGLIADGVGFGSSDAFEVYDVEANSWEILSPLPTGLHHLTLTSTETAIYLTGGYDGGDFNLDVQATWKYQPENDTWIQLADMPFPRAAHTMQAIEDKLYVIGGEGNHSVELWIYDVQEDVWQISEAEMSAPREHLTSAVVDGKLYVIGGRWRSRGNLGTVEVYDPASDTWEILTEMPTPRGGLTAAIVNGYIHVTGGEDLNSADTYREHEVYDPTSDTWETFPPLPTARHGLASASIDNQWVVIGGATGAGFRTLVSLQDMVEIYTIGIE